MSEEPSMPRDNLMSVEQAQALYCPHMKDPDGNPWCCWGDRCANWRWHSEVEEGTRRGGLGLAMRPTGRLLTCGECQGSKVDPSASPEEIRRGEGMCVECKGKGKVREFAPVGYCGLAGGPS